MEQSVAMLLEHSMRHGLTYWQARGRSFKAALAMRRGDVAIGLQLFERARDDFREIPYAMSYVILLTELAQSIGRIGHAARGLVAIEEAIDQCGRIEAGWCMAELLRIKGDLVLLESSGMAVPTAEGLFAESLAWARRQGALSWELRTSISLARLRRSQEQTREAHDLLASTYGRFTEGFETVDLLTATRLIGELAQGVTP
jgi:predicted ATPase